MSPTAQSSPVQELGKGRDSISLEVTSRGMGQAFTYSVQFVAPALVRYYMPGVRPPALKASWTWASLSLSA